MLETPKEAVSGGGLWEGLGSGGQGSHERGERLIDKAPEVCSPEGASPES